MPKYLLFEGLLYTKPEFEEIYKLVRAGKPDEARPKMRAVMLKYKQRMHAKPRRHHRAKRD